MADVIPLLSPNDQALPPQTTGGTTAAGFAVVVPQVVQIPLDTPLNDLQFIADCKPGALLTGFYIVECPASVRLTVRYGQQRAKLALQGQDFDFSIGSCPGVMNAGLGFGTDVAAIGEFLTIELYFFPGGASVAVAQP